MGIRFPPVGPHVVLAYGNAPGRGDALPAELPWAETLDLHGWVMPGSEEEERREVLRVRATVREILRQHGPLPGLREVVSVAQLPSDLEDLAELAPEAESLHVLCLTRREGPGERRVSLGKAPPMPALRILSLRGHDSTGGDAGHWRLDLGALGGHLRALYAFGAAGCQHDAVRSLLPAPALSVMWAPYAPLELALFRDEDVPSLEHLAFSQSFLGEPQAWPPEAVARLRTLVFEGDAIPGLMLRDAASVREVGLCTASELPGSAARRLVSALPPSAEALHLDCPVRCTLVTEGSASPLRRVHLSPAAPAAPTNFVVCRGGQVVAHDGPDLMLQVPPSMLALHDCRE